MLIDVFLVVGDQGLISVVSPCFGTTSPSEIDWFDGHEVHRIHLADGLSDGVNLAGLTTTSHTHTDVNVGELVETNDEKRLVDLEAQDGGFD